MAKTVYKPYVKPSRKKRPGIHSKTRSSKGKNCKNYIKAYRGQGR